MRAVICNDGHDRDIDGFCWTNCPACLFIPHLQRCEADDGRGSDFGRCDEYARARVTTETGDRYVCDFHKAHWKAGGTPPTRDDR